jgi:hypothetical protein
MKQLKTYELFSFLKREDPLLKKMRELDQEIRSNFKNVQVTKEDDKTIWDFKHLGEDVKISCSTHCFSFSGERLIVLYTVDNSSTHSIYFERNCVDHQTEVEFVINLVRERREVESLEKEITKEDIEFAFSEIADLEYVSEFQVYYFYRKIEPVVCVQFMVDGDLNIDSLLDGMISQVKSVYGVDVILEKRKGSTTDIFDYMIYRVIIKKK